MIVYQYFTYLAGIYSQARIQRGPAGTERDQRGLPLLETASFKNFKSGPRISRFVRFSCTLYAGGGKHYSGLFSCTRRVTAPHLEDGARPV